jgi:hypothetical protein
MGHRAPLVGSNFLRLLITSGGATSFLNLVLYLVERFAGHDRANLAAKVLLVDGHRPSQLPYIAFGRERSHGDVIVHQVQQHIDLHLDEQMRIAGLAAAFRAKRAHPVPTVRGRDRPRAPGRWDRPGADRLGAAGPQVPARG